MFVHSRIGPQQILPYHATNCSFNLEWLKKTSWCIFHLERSKQGSQSQVPPSSHSIQCIFCWVPKHLFWDDIEKITFSRGSQMRMVTASNSTTIPILLPWFACCGFQLLCLRLSNRWVCVCRGGGVCVCVCVCVFLIMTIHIGRINMIESYKHS